MLLSLVLVLLVVGIPVVSCSRSNFDIRNSTKPSGRHPPNFFIIGAAKCGTTSLHALLQTHKEICNIGTKELHYFDRPKEFHKGSRSYFQHFNTKCQHYYIDSTPDYLSHQDTVPREIVATYSPEDLKTKKFIVVLRDPVYRAYSWYNHLMKHCTASMSDYMKSKVSGMPKLGWDTFELCEDVHCAHLQCRSRASLAIVGQEVKFLSTFSEYYESNNLDIAKGHYITQLKTWLNFIPRNQIFIINLSALLEEPSDTLNRITDFLGISHFPTRVSLPHENVATVETVFDCATRKELYKHYDPFTANLMDFMHANSSSTDREEDQKPPMEPYFKPFVEYRCQ